MKQLRIQQLQHNYAGCMGVCVILRVVVETTLWNGFLDSWVQLTRYAAAPTSYVVNIHAVIASEMCKIIQIQLA